MTVQPNKTRSLSWSFLGIAAALSGGPAALAQLREPEVLVVYDSRISDSLFVAEAYVGSAKVPGGTGIAPGAHPGARVIDLSTLAATGGGQAGFAVVTPDIDYTTFKSNIRDPLRNYLTANHLIFAIRSILLTKGIPHRVLDHTTPAIGDNPALLGQVICGGNVNFASVDAELTALWQNLDSGEAGGPGDSYIDGWIVNPYARASLPHSAWTRRNNCVGKVFTVPIDDVGCESDLGVWWLNPPAPDVSNAATLTPGDIYLVCRLDGNTVGDVTGALARAQNLVVNTTTANFLLDSDGFPLEGGDGPPSLDAGLDYSNTHDLLVADGRFVASNVRYNTMPGVSQYFVGPRIAFSGGPIVISNPVLLIASYGSNHSGVGSPMSTTYANSFNYAPGAVFNTIESYNGRAYGGLGQNVSVPQQQSADAITAGCTFAIGNVWEPFTLTIADNQFIVQNFYLGNLSWAEAAYTGLPAISWAQIVVGDPLARVRRDREDINADGKLTIDDLYAWHASPRDLNRSGVADSADYALLEAAVRGPEAANMKGDQR